ncbi:Ferredoxin--sulfite reductase [hydrothermal vent metagenome]|uniref:Ferredoxin--sulfite reductase n=1 Tax=hydrothermal vent metagenome TaxID=652676 RepID=A0A3B1AS00_9ZZZZ
MNVAGDFIRQEDFDQLEQAIQDYQDEKIDHNRLVGERLMLGVYGQWQENLCMVRSKLPGGEVPLPFLLGYAEGLEKFDCLESVHLTTRQDIQYNDVPLEQTPDLLRMLAGYGITSREACGNTVRNVSACPMAGMCPKEHVDVMPHTRATAAYLIRNPLTQSLPRKFKITYSGCEADCAQGPIQDLGIVATRKKGKPGFKLLAGGGLGPKPRMGIVIEEFLDEEMLLPAIEAVLAMHDKYSDRERKSCSRIKFLVERFGAEGFIEKFREEMVRTSAAFDTKNAPRGEWRQADEDGQICGHGAPRQIMAQHQQGKFAVPVYVPGGDLSAEQLRGLHDLLVAEGYPDLRVTQDQNLIVCNVPESGISALTKGLEALQLSLPAPGSNVVACPGTTTCQLGITSSRVVAKLLDGGESDLTVRVNGCQNNCAHSDITDIGFYGKAKRHFGQLIPSYAIRLGGRGMTGGEFAFSGPEVPAVRVPVATKRIHDAYVSEREGNESFFTWSRRLGPDYFDNLLNDLVQVREFELSMLQRDHGDSAVFKVISSGVGECAGANIDPVDKLLLDIAYERNLRDAFAAKRKFKEAAESMANIFALIGKALLSSAGAEETSPPEGEVAAALAAAMPDDSSMANEFAALFEAFVHWLEDLDELAYPALIGQIDAWVKGARMQCRTLQANKN